MYALTLLLLTSLHHDLHGRIVPAHFPSFGHRNTSLHLGVIYSKGALAGWNPRALPSFPRKRASVGQKRTDLTLGQDGPRLQGIINNPESFKHHLSALLPYAGSWLEMQSPTRSYSFQLTVPLPTKHSSPHSQIHEPNLEPYCTYLDSACC